MTGETYFCVASEKTLRFASQCDYQKGKEMHKKKHREKKKKIYRMRAQQLRMPEVRSVATLETFVSELAARLEDDTEATRVALLSFAARIERPLVLLLFEMIEKTFALFGEARTEQGTILPTKSAFFYYRLERDFPEIFQKIQQGEQPQASEREDEIFEDDVTWFLEHPECTQFLRLRHEQERTKENCVFVAQLAERKHALLGIDFAEDDTVYQMILSLGHVDVTDIDMSDSLPSNADFPALL